MLLAAEDPRERGMHILSSIPRKQTFREGFAQIRAGGVMPEGYTMHMV